ncbi:hypothetical protein AC477_00070 [miscellaneous Crenarchaeota group-1 archaeon SG8-32-1]|uniref:Uncharacterized protein n=1 Tax=miscellaneous Crenarchaeota group-1 archaeon SG8-32-1 TaxID=1685124 RepID=A0A0M0C2R6_9ARCH|nr:MAG: hypothetical protein AC477_00070 [miscellaneous Crenarchaeota group-1 archaeon SG8-32-1]
MVSNIFDNGFGHNPNVFKDYDVIRCVHCDQVIKVPKIAMSFVCPYCEGIIEFEEEEVVDN